MKQLWRFFNFFGVKKYDTAGESAGKIIGNL
jgi:hypothetical protein